MELLDSDDALKGQLMRKSAEHRVQLEEDLRLITDRTEKIFTNALIIGGALAATYFLITKLSESKGKRKSKVKKLRLAPEEESPVMVETVDAGPPSLIAQIGTSLASQATVLLLTFAKEKLMEYLEAQAVKKENVNGNS